MARAMALHRCRIHCALIAVGGDPRTGPLLEALKDQRLLYSAETKKVFIKDRSGKVTDAAGGGTVNVPPADIDTVRLNNRVRGMVDAALGSLTLMAKEPGRRFDAAQAVFKSRDSRLHCCPSHPVRSLEIFLSMSRESPPFAGFLSWPGVSVFRI